MKTQQVITRIKNHSNDSFSCGFQKTIKMEVQIVHNEILELLTPKSAYDFDGRGLYKNKRETYAIT